jgi:hypothetical protein
VREGEGDWDREGRGEGVIVGEDGPRAVAEIVGVGGEVGVSPPPPPPRPPLPPMDPVAVTVAVGSWPLAVGDRVRVGVKVKDGEGVGGREGVDSMVRVPPPSSPPLCVPVGGLPVGDTLVEALEDPSCPAVCVARGVLESMAERVGERVGVDEAVEVLLTLALTTSLPPLGRLRVGAMASVSGPGSPATQVTRGVLEFTTPEACHTPFPSLGSIVYTATPMLALYQAPEPSYSVKRI